MDLLFVCLFVCLLSVNLFLTGYWEILSTKVLAKENKNKIPAMLRWFYEPELCRFSTSPAVSLSSRTVGLGCGWKSKAACRPQRNGHAFSSPPRRSHPATCFCPCLRASGKGGGPGRCHPQPQKVPCLSPPSAPRCAEMPLSSR